MLSWLKTFFTTIPKIGSGLLTALPNPWFLLGALAAIVGAYFVGSYRGDTAGYNRATAALTAQCDARVQAKQDELNTYVLAANKRTDEMNQKIAGLEADSAYQALQLEKLKAANDKKRTDIVDKYRLDNPQTSVQCGLSTPALNAITQIMSVK